MHPKPLDLDSSNPPHHRRGHKDGKKHVLTFCETKGNDNIILLYIIFFDDVCLGVIYGNIQWLGRCLNEAGNTVVLQFIGVVKQIKINSSNFPHELPPQRHQINTVKTELPPSKNTAHHCWLPNRPLGKRPKSSASSLLSSSWSSEVSIGGREPRIKSWQDKAVDHSGHLPKTSC